MQKTLNRFQIKLPNGQPPYRIFIDGKEVCMLNLEILHLSILNSEDVEDDDFDKYRRSLSDRMLEYGHCDEDCCPSLWIKIEKGEYEVRWYDFSRSFGANQAALKSEYVFDRKSYEIQLNKVLDYLIQTTPRMLDKIKL